MRVFKSNKVIIAVIGLMLELYLRSNPLVAQISFERYYDFGYTEEGYSVCKSHGSGYVVAGQERRSIGDSRQLLFEVDSVGDVLWSRTYGTIYDNALYNIKPTLDGGYIAVGYTTNSAYTNFPTVVKIDSSGDTMWTTQNISPIAPQPFGGEGNGLSQDVVQLADSNYLVISCINDYDTLRIILLSKLNSSGDTIWTNKIRLPLGLYVGNIIQTYDGGFAISSRKNYTLTPVFTAAGLIIKTDANGDTSWTREYPFYTTNTGFSSVMQTSDTGYILCGASYWGVGNTDNYIVRANQVGDTVWTKNIGGTANDGGRAVQTSDGGFFIGGNSFSYGAGSSDVYILKLDSNGGIQWQRTYGGVNFENANSISQTNDAGFIICGFETSFGNGNGNVYLIKTDSAGYAPTGLNPLAPKIDRLSAYPNPNDGEFTIEYVVQEKGYLQLLNIYGIPVAEYEIPEYANSITIQKDLPAGLYFCRMIVGGALIGCEKIIVK